MKALNVSRRKRAAEAKLIKRWNDQAAVGIEFSIVIGAHPTSLAQGRQSPQTLTLICYRKLSDPKNSSLELFESTT